MPAGLDYGVPLLRVAVERDAGVQFVGRFGDALLQFAVQPVVHFLFGQVSAHSEGSTWTISMAYSRFWEYMVTVSQPGSGRVLGNMDAGLRVAFRQVRRPSAMMHSIRVWTKRGDSQALFELAVNGQGGSAVGVAVPVPDDKHPVGMALPGLGCGYAYPSIFVWGRRRSSRGSAAPVYWPGGIQNDGALWRLRAATMMPPARPLLSWTRADGFEVRVLGGQGVGVRFGAGVGCFQVFHQPGQ